MLICILNHHPDVWSEEQRKAAIDSFGEIKYIPFPIVDPLWSRSRLLEEVKKYLDKTKEIIKDNELFVVDNTVMVMGEMGFTWNFVAVLKCNNIKAVHATSKRVREKGKPKYEFVTFREY